MANTGTTTRSRGSTPKRLFTKVTKWLEEGSELMPQLRAMQSNGIIGGEGEGARGGTRAQHAKAGRAGGKATARKRTNSRSGSSAKS